MIYVKELQSQCTKKKCRIFLPIYVSPTEKGEHVTNSIQTLNDDLRVIKND